MIEIMRVLRGIVPVAGLSFVHLVDDMYQGAVPALIPFLVVERQYTYAAATGITVAATFLSSVLQPLFGVLTDRRRLAFLIPSGVAIAGIGIGLSGLGPHYVFTWLAIALSGIGVAAFHPEASRAARVASHGSARGMSWFALGGNIGFALGPLLVTAVLTGGGLTATPLLAIPAVATGLVVALLQRRSRDAVAKKTTETDRVDDWSSFRWLTGLVMCRSICFFGVNSLLALFLTKNLGFTESTGNAALTVLLATGAAGTLLGGALADRYGRVRTVRLGYLLIVPGLLALLFAPNAVVAYLAAALLGFALYIPFSVQVTLGQDYLPNRIGTASGVTLGLAVSVGGIVTPVFGLLADHAGLSTALAVLLVFPVAALAISTRLPDTKPQVLSTTAS